MSASQERRTVHVDPAPLRVSRREKIAAAKVMVVIDERTGRQTPQWIVDLANEEPPPLREPA